ncbi:MAG TPA: exodeoxyribonuclease III [Fimbriimonadaceae bacterium]|nr:exodeoxyribonuclease III [Fimbriimonadaceae bacterium]
MVVATFNVNSVRARVPVLLDWLASAQPDVLVLQETKVEDAKFPFDDLEPSGYAIEIHGQPRYNGVAVLSRLPIEDVEFGFDDEDMPEDCRLLRATINGVQIINTYVPNGNEVGSEKWEYKMKWLEVFRDYVEETCDLGAPTVWLGDINIAPAPDDVFEPESKLGDVGHHPDEFSRLKAIVDLGWTDLFRRSTAGPGHYTFWDFRIPNSFGRNLGWRIDHIYASPALAGKCRRCWIDTAPRTAERPSDHTPVLADFMV